MTDASIRELTPGDRRELRSLIKKQFQVLRNDVKRRESEMKAEVEQELLYRYRQQDEHVEAAQRDLEKAAQDYRDACEAIMDSLRAVEPSLLVNRHSTGQLWTTDKRRGQLHAALVAAIPQRVASAQVHLDQQELELLRELTISALDSEVATRFLNSIPTIAELVPQARLAEIEGMVK